MSNHLFSPLTLRETTIPNRVTVSPMCMYSCEARDGLATEFHHVHLGSRASGGAGLVLTEATAVTPRGRITPEDLGIWSQEHADALAPITDFIRSQGSVPGIQLAHAGRKGSKTRPWEGGDSLDPDEGGWATPAPSDVPWPSDEPPELEVLTTDRIEVIERAFVDAAKHSLRAGFDVIELHAAHGYLFHEFLSPHTNHRDDAYGGDFENRSRIVVETVEAIREVWPAEKPLLVRVSATDWLGEDAWTADQTVRLAERLESAGVDLVDVSTGALDPAQTIPHTGSGYQVPFAERVRSEAGIPVGPVGGITAPEHADALVRNGRADLVVVGREHLRDPYFALHAAEKLGQEDGVSWPDQYDYAV